MTKYLCYTLYGYQIYLPKSKKDKNVKYNIFYKSYILL